MENKIYYHAMCLFYDYKHTVILASPPVQYHQATVWSKTRSVEQVYDHDGRRKVTETFDNKVVFGKF